MSVEGARAAYVAAENAMDDHRAGCPVCGNSRLKYPPSCPEGDVLKGNALELRKGWADAVAEQRRKDGNHGQVEQLLQRAPGRVREPADPTPAW